MTPHQTTHYGLLCKLKSFDFSDRQRRLLEAILEKSFGRNREKAYFPRLEHFVLLTGMSAGNVSTNLGYLIRAKVVEKCSDGVYAVRLPVEQWAVPERVQQTAAWAAVDKWLDLDPPQMDLVPEPDSLTQALREVAINFPAVCRETVRDGGTAGQRYADQPTSVQSSVMGSGPVPETGTAVPETGTAVPETGTGLKALKVQSLERCTTAFNSELSTLKEGLGEPNSRFGNVPELDLEAEWLNRVREVVGELEGKSYAPWYRLRYRENRDKAERVLAEVAVMNREGRIRKSAGKTYYWLWLTEFGAYPDRAR